MEKLKEKKVKTYCPSCGVEQEFTYINLENIVEDLTYWEIDCNNCGMTKCGFSKIGFDNI